LRVVVLKLSCGLPATPVPDKETVVVAPVDELLEIVNAPDVELAEVGLN
jgi:hypothetical protein